MVWVVFYVIRHFYHVDQQILNGLKKQAFFVELSGRNPNFDGRQEFQIVYFHYLLVGHIAQFSQLQRLSTNFKESQFLGLDGHQLYNFWKKFGILLHLHEYQRKHLVLVIFFTFLVNLEFYCHQVHLKCDLTINGVLFRGLLHHDISIVLCQLLERQNTLEDLLVVQIVGADVLIFETFLKLVQIVHHVNSKIFCLFLGHVTCSLFNVNKFARVDVFKLF